MSQLKIGPQISSRRRKKIFPSNFVNEGLKFLRDLERNVNYFHQRNFNRRIYINKVQVFLKYLETYFHTLQHPRSENRQEGMDVRYAKCAYGTCRSADSYAAHGSGPSF